MVATPRHLRERRQQFTNCFKRYSFIKAMIIIMIIECPNIVDKVQQTGVLLELCHHNNHSLLL